MSTVYAALANPNLPAWKAESLIRWQDEQARCFRMAELCREEGDLDSACFWQDEAARSHACLRSNSESRGL